MLKRIDGIITIEVSLQGALEAFYEALKTNSQAEPANENLQNLTIKFQTLLSNVNWDQDRNVLTTRIAF